MKYGGKPLHCQFSTAREEVRSRRSWDRLQKGYLKKKTESTMTLCRRNLRNVFYGENVQSICCVCGAADETVAHVVSECSKLAQKEYKQVRHDNVAKMLHWKLCEKWGFNKVEEWYIHKPEKVLESEDCKIM